MATFPFRTEADVGEGALPVAFQSLDADGTIRCVDDTWTAITGYDGESVRGTPFTALLRSEGATRFQAVLEELESGSAATAELAVLDAGGEEVPITVEAHPEVGADGRIERIHCQFTERSSSREPDRFPVHSERLLRTLFDGLPIGIVAETSDREVLAVNDAVLAFFEVAEERETLMGTDCAALAEAVSDRCGDPAGFTAGVEARIAAGEPVEGERIEMTAGRTLERRYLPIELPAGDGHLWVYEDVTDQRAREEELETYERLFDVAPVGVFRTTVDGRVLATNQKLARTLGYDTEPALLAAYDDLETDLYADAERRGEFLALIDERDTVEDFEYEAVAKDGRRRWISMNARMLDETVDGSRVIAGFTRDVTERVRRERDLETYEEIVQRLSDPIMLQDLEGRFQVANEAVAEFAGVPAADLLGADEHAFMDAAAASRIDSMKATVLRTEQPVEYRVEPTFEDRGQRSFQTLRYPYYDEAGALAGTVAIGRDVTDQRQRERQLAVLGRVLRHNLRNAMTVVQGQAELLATGRADDPAAAAAKIHSQVETLLRQADKERAITELLRETTGRKTRDVVALIEEIRLEVAAEYPEATVEVDLPLTATVSVCETFELAVRELLENALRHTDSDEPTVTVCVRREGESVELRVADDGPGIPEMEQKVLLAETDVTPLYHGTGVGLWLVQWLVHCSNGSLTFEENDPRGSVVTVRLPAA